MQKHYIEITKYFQKMFLLNSQMLRDLSCLHPEMYMKTATVCSIERFAKRVPHVISVEDMPKIVDVWKALQAEAISEGCYQQEVVDEDEKLTKKMICVDHFCRKVFKIKLPSGDLKYATLQNLLRHCCVSIIGIPIAKDHCLTIRKLLRITLLNNPISLGNRHDKGNKKNKRAYQ